MEIESVAGDSVRIPTPRPGVATAVRRYGDERAVVLHPKDFQRLADLERLVAELSESPPVAASDAAIKAHVDSDTPGAPVVDPDALDTLFPG